MRRCTDWQKHWNERSAEVASDFSFNRGGGPWQKEVAELSERELLSFIDPKSNEMIFDAGCGTGGNMFLLHSKVKRVVGMDYSTGAVARCQSRLRTNNIDNVQVSEGNITQLPLPSSSIDKLLCLSVLHYMDDAEVGSALNEFTRVLTDHGVLILHVKNLSSIYLRMLSVLKKAKLLFGKQAKLAYFRSFRWYKKALTSRGFDIVDYNSFNLLLLPGMPTSLVLLLQKLELRHCTSPLLRMGFLRRHGSDLKIKAVLRKRISV